MKATEARIKSQKINESGVDKIFQSIDEEASVGRYQLEIAILNRECQEILKQFGYEVKWIDSGFRDDGCWRISW